MSLFLVSYFDAVILEIKNLWPEVKLVRGSARHSESNGGVERENQTVEKKLGAWMKDNNSKGWSVACKVIQGNQYLNALGH